MEIRSLADFVRTTRGALVAAGLVRREAGGAVWFEGGKADGEPIVLVHGVNDQAGTWFTLVPALAATHHLIVPDLAGHGESAPREGALAMTFILSELERVIEESCGHRHPCLCASVDTRETRTDKDVCACRTDVTLVGNSLGGWLAMLYTLDHPSQVKRLVLESAGGLSRPFSSLVVATSRDEALSVIRAVHGPSFDPPEWAIEALIERASGSPLQRITGADAMHVDARLREIAAPTTIIWGADDGVLPRDYGEALRDAIPNATFHVIERAAHIPHIQNPKRVLACLSSIL